MSEESRVPEPPGGPQWRGVGAVLLVLTTITALLLGWGAQEGPTRAGAIFAGVGVVLMLLTLIIAVVAAAYARFHYQDLVHSVLRRPELKLRLEVLRNDQSRERFPEVEGRYHTSDDRLVVRCILRNDGTRIAEHATLNIYVPTSCKFRSLGGGSAPDPSWTERIAPQETTTVFFGAERRVRFCSWGPAVIPVGPNIIVEIGVDLAEPGDYEIGANLQEGMNGQTFEGRTTIMLRRS